VDTSDVSGTAAGNGITWIVSGAVNIGVRWVW